MYNIFGGEWLILLCRFLTASVLESSIPVQFSLFYFFFSVLTFGLVIFISCFNNGEIKQELKSTFCKGQRRLLGSGTATERRARRDWALFP